jgi:hypothetical protein
LAGKPATQVALRTRDLAGGCEGDGFSATPEKRFPVWFLETGVSKSTLEGALRAPDHNYLLKPGYAGVDDRHWIAGRSLRSAPLGCLYSIHLTVKLWFVNSLGSVATIMEVLRLKVQTPRAKSDSLLLINGLNFIHLSGPVVQKNTENFPHEKADISFLCKKYMIHSGLGRTETFT